MTDSPKKTILIADDNESLRHALTVILARADYEVISAADGHEALQKCRDQKVDLVISDIRMPRISGLELLKAVKKSGEKAFILMTGFSDLAQAQEASALGVHGLLAKPFRREELLQLVAGSFTEKERSPEAAPEDVQIQYCKLNIEDFISGKTLQYDIFLCISDRKFVKVAHQGEDIPIERIRAYKSRDLKYLYMKKEDFKRYVGFNLALVGATAENRAILREKKARLLKHTGEVITQLVRFDGLDADSYGFARTYVENSIEILGEQEGALDLLNLLSQHTDHLYAHSVGVSMLGVLLARSMQWSSVGNLFKIAMGGLLHDLGKKEIDQEILGKARKDQTAQEIKLIESHTLRGLELIGRLRSIPDDICAIISQHHEHCSGQGYPHGLRKSRIHPLARLIAVADEYCNLVLKVPGGPELPCLEAVRRLATVAGHRLDPEMLDALARLFKSAPARSPRPTGREPVFG